MHAGPLPADHPFAAMALTCEGCGESIYSPAEGSIQLWGEFGGRNLCAPCLGGKKQLLDCGIFNLSRGCT